MQNEIVVIKQIGNMIRVIKTHHKFVDFFIVQVFVPGVLSEGFDWVFINEFEDDSDAENWAVLMQDLIEARPMSFIEQAEENEEESA